MSGRALPTLIAILAAGEILAGEFRLPTANRALLNRNEQEKYFAGTAGRSWESGTFGCVRSSGWQMHEGLDVRSIQHDKAGEPTDPVLATAEGRVAYLNNRPSLSNYGNYVILQHVIDGVEIYSIYAHLAQIRPGLKSGLTLRAGEAIGIMGRTSNTRERIGKERAHVHFELNMFVNEAFPGWYKKTFPGQRNDHGIWNGQNMIGVDPRLVLLSSQREGTKFNLADWLRGQPELCRVFVRKTDFPWLKRYSLLVEKNSARKQIAGYEVVLNFNGLPFKMIPRSATEVKSQSKYVLLSVNDAEYQKNPCRKLVVRRGKSWELTSGGIRLLDLLTY
jgi:peptidoglycan LD-endopeptidase LytH